MKSFNELYVELQDQSGDSSAALLTRFKRWVNDTQRAVIGSHPWKFLEKTGTITTTASNARYELFADLRKIITVTTTPDSGTTLYRPTAIDDSDFWEYLQSLNATDSDFPVYYYQEGNDLLLWPDYGTAGHEIRVRYRQRVIDMTLADYTTGTIESITKGARAVVGVSAPAWTSRKPVRNQWMRFTPDSDGDGDFRWYEIKTIDSDTTLTLEKDYLGDTVASSTLAYVMGEMPIVPEEHQAILIERPLAIYYASIENIQMAKFHWQLYDGGYEIGLRERPGGMLQKFINEQAGTLDAKYYPPQGSSEPLNPEDIARTTTSTLG